jgi:predicted kinase
VDLVWRAPRPARDHTRMSTRHKPIPSAEVLSNRTAADAVATARLHARLAVARVRLLDATTLRDRRAKELRELIHEATASSAGAMYLVTE